MTPKGREFSRLNLFISFFPFSPSSVCVVWWRVRREDRRESRLSPSSSFSLKKSAYSCRKTYLSEEEALLLSRSLLVRFHFEMRIIRGG